MYLCDKILHNYDSTFSSPHPLGPATAMLGDILSLLALCLACCWTARAADLRLVNEWAQLEFVFPDEASRQDALANREYVPGNSVPIDVDVHYTKNPRRTRVFMTVPRFDEGRPATLVTVEEGRLKPYPDYSWNNNQGNNCEGLTSVFRVAIDDCHRLWVMDTGKIGDTRRCAPQLLAFDLETDQLLYRHRFRDALMINSSLFITPVMDVRGSGGGDCHDTFAYIADVTGFGIVVVDVARDRSWRISHRLFFPYPSHGSFKIDGERFDLMDGILGMALSPRSARTGERVLYFHALASVTENFVRTSVLRNESFIEHSDADPDSISVFYDQRSTQSAAEAIDRNGIMYFGLMNPPSLACWNTGTDYRKKNIHIISNNEATLQFASGVKVVNNGKGDQELWVLTCSFQRVMTGTLDSSRINFRIQAEKIPELLESSACTQSPNGNAPYHHANHIGLGPKVHIGSYRYGAVTYL